MPAKLNNSKKSSKSTKIFNLIITAVPILLITSSVLGWYIAQPPSGYVKTSATVISVSAGGCSPGDSDTLAFKNQSGTTIDVPYVPFEVGQSGQTCDQGPSLGEKLSIAYNPNDPSSNLKVTGLESYATPLGLLAAGVVTGFLVIRMRKKPNNKPLS